MENRQGPLGTRRNVSPARWGRGLEVSLSGFSWEFLPGKNHFQAGVGSLQLIIQRDFRNWQLLHWPEGYESKFRRNSGQLHLPRRENLIRQRPRRHLSALQPAPRP